MHEIKCPNCGNVFSIDESGYAQILKQVRDEEFEKELKKRESDLADKKENDLKMLEIKQEQTLKDTITAKDAEIAKKESEIEKLKLEKENETERLQAKLTQQINDLRSELEKSRTEKELAITKAVQEKEKDIADKTAEIAKLNSELELQAKENKLTEARLIDQHKGELQLRDDEIERLKDFKTRLSTKMVGESLEQHCSNQFNEIRMTAFPRAYFEKDNDARTGSKCDFIFRDYDEDGTEVVSIMFEMKNEMDTTATKHKNEDFFKELDKDRREKNCEYAILVSMLEADNEFYNNGIVDVSYRYEKMYVIRPQFFIPIITLLRNAALNSLGYQKELAIVRSQQVDIINFEDNMNAFKDAFSRNYRLASEKFGKAIEEIDKTIMHLQKTKEALLSSENNLRLANNKAEDLSIKKLTKNAPSVREMFDNLE